MGIIGTLPRVKAPSAMAGVRRSGINVLGLATVLGLLAVWEAAGATGLLPASSIPRPSAIGTALGTMAGTPAFWAAVGATVTAALTGLAIVVVIALPMALLISRYEFFRLSTWIPIEFLKPIPPVALIPLGLLMVGPTAQLKISLIVFAALWPLVTQMVYGMKEIDGAAKDMSRSYRLGTWLGLTRITLPSILPFAVTGLRISAAIALVVAIVVELIAGVPGLGQTIGLAQISGQIAQMYAGIVVAGFLGLAFNAVFSLAAKKLLFWHPSVRSVS